MDYHVSRSELIELLVFEYVNVFDEPHTTFVRSPDILMLECICITTVPLDVHERVVESIQQDPS